MIKVLTSQPKIAILNTWKRTSVINLTQLNQEDNDVKIFFEAKPVLVIAIVTAIEEIVEKHEALFSYDELNELERVAKAIERQVHEAN